MTIDRQTRVRPRALSAALIVVGCLLAACGKSTPPASAAAQPVSSKAAESSPPFNVASIFPPGPGRDPVLNTCGSCHSVVCVTRGQRTGERWESLQKDHKDKLTNVSGAQLNLMFAYLKANFNYTKPEPRVPAELLQQGCTPF